MHFILISALFTNYRFFFSALNMISITARLIERAMDKNKFLRLVNLFLKIV